MMSDSRRGLMIKLEELKRVQAWYKDNDMTESLAEGAVPPVVDLDFDFYIDLVTEVLSGSNR